MMCTSPVTTLYFMVKWVFITGDHVKNFEVDKLWAFCKDPNYIRLNDNADTYLRKEDAKVFGKLVVKTSSKIMD